MALSEGLRGCSSHMASRGLEGRRLVADVSWGEARSTKHEAEGCSSPCHRLLLRALSPQR